MSIFNEDGYVYAYMINPTKNDTYLVKTEGNTYEFAFWDGEEWNIQGDNKGAKVKLWANIPTTDG